MFKRIISGIMAIAFCVVVLSGCGEATTDAEMPEIVFVKFYWDYADVITGEYIDKYGYIRSFKFDDMPYEPDKSGDFTILDVKKIEQYTEARNVEKVHTLITEHYKIVSDEAIIKKIGQKEI